MSEKFNIGVDFGGVLSIHDSKTTNVSGSEHRNTAINMPLAEDSVKFLKDQGHNLHLISFCGKSRAAETRVSMNDSGLSDLFKGMYFVKSKPSKNELCQHLGCHFMIDDNIEILDNIKAHNSKIVTILFDGDEHPVHKCAKDWNSVLKIIDETEYFDATTSTASVAKFLY